jgi:hypothetical protein
MRRAAAAALLLGIASVPSAARAVCAGPLCGGLASAQCSTLPSQEFDVTDGALADQSLGPAHVTREPNPNDSLGAGNRCEGSSRAQFALEQGVFAVEAGTLSDAHDYGLNEAAGAASRIQFDEYLNVTSATVGNGTPVTIRLRMRVAFGADAQHDLPANQLDVSSQYSYIDLIFESNFGSSYLLQRWYRNADGTAIVSGAFADPTQPFEITANTTVGGTIRLSFSLRDYANSKAVVKGGTPNLFPTAQTGGTAAVVLGLESDTPGVSITSPTLGGQMPDFSGVTAANALAHVIPVDVGAPVVVPEPGGRVLGAAALAALVLLRRRYAAPSHAIA